MTNDERDRALYKYPSTDILRNKFDLRNASELRDAEKLHVRQRMREAIPEGEFDQDHLCAIHHHLFQDVYEWAGEPRQTDITKGDSVFIPHSRIYTGLADVHDRLLQQNYLKDRTQEEFAGDASVIIGDINYVHPFREGNGRTQLIYLQQLGQQAGHEIDLTRLSQRPWIEASKDTAKPEPDYGNMEWCIEKAIEPEREHEKYQEQSAEQQQESERER